MTKHECAVVMAFTGIVMLQHEDFDIYQKYVEELIGEPIYTHQLADRDVINYIRERSEPDFIRLCMTATD